MDWEAFFGALVAVYSHMHPRLKFVASNYGTSRSENRYLFGDYVERTLLKRWNEAPANKSLGIFKHNPKAKHVDLDLVSPDFTLGVSVKYSSSGAIRLHNRLLGSKVCEYMARDIPITIVFTKELLCLLVPDVLKDYGVQRFVVDRVDNVQLRRAVLKHLEQSGYPFIYTFPKELRLHATSKNISMAHLLEDHVERVFGLRNSGFIA